jgi:hypothetical protein
MRASSVRTVTSVPPRRTTSACKCASDSDGAEAGDGQRADAGEQPGAAAQHGADGGADAGAAIGFVRIRRLLAAQQADLVMGEAGRLERLDRLGGAGVAVEGSDVGREGHGMFL